jgi:hypothetical protein
MIETVDISRLDIDYILSLPEVIKAKEQISLQSEGSVYFNIDLNSYLRNLLCEKFKLNLFGIHSIPMRWMKGDTKPHIDTSNHIFDKTYLAYLTDSQGHLLIDGESYPISKGKAYIFSEGLQHETIGTGVEPRLLLGPMSETGIPVGGATTIQADGATEIIYIRYDAGSGTTYKINNGSYNGFSLPLTIENTNPINSTLQVLFETDIVLFTNIWYIICGSDNIQFGSNTLNTNGTIPIITIDNVLNYPGLIRNGSSTEDGYNNITVKNIGITTSNDSRLDNPGGWVCQAYFGKNATNNNIINCYSTGYISPGSGGIVGIHAADSGGNLTINKCFSLGFIDNEAGGIVGNNASSNSGIISITNCYSFGEIGGTPSVNGAGGGIVGSFANQVNISNCYSLGQISGNDCGGIIGLNFSNNNTSTIITNCYSIGNIIAARSGGIAPGIAGGNPNATIQNCYTTGSVPINSYGIAPPDSNLTITNCYSEGDNSGSGWNDTNANNHLNTGSWTSVYPNTNYLLKIFNQTLYSQSPYTRSGQQTFTTDLGLIQNTDPDFKYYLINQPSGVTYNSTTGAITFENNIEPGTYTINIVCGIDPPGQFYNYNINSFIFTQGVIPDVTPHIPICFPAGTPVLTDQGEIPIDKINKKIHTICGKEIVTITETISTDSYLICIERNSLGNNVPNRKTFISKDHKVLCDKKMVRSEYLIQYIPTIYKVQYNKERLYNVVLREHSIMSVNNLIVETMNPDHILAKIYSGNYTPQEKNRLILMVNNYHQKQKRKSFIKNNIFTA